MIRQALAFIDPFDRDTWVRCCFAIKSELGDAGFEIWDEWSQGAPNYEPGAARATWKHAKASGGVRIGTLYALARRNGWRSSERPESRTVRHDELVQRRRTEQLLIEQRQATARDRAMAMLMRAHIATHPYLSRKGFPETVGFVLEDALLIPMRIGKVVHSVQRILPDGSKRFLKDSLTKGAYFEIGHAAERFLCEGYATGLSIRAAFEALHRSVAVTVCFSAANLRLLGTKAPRTYVVADNDASGVGEKYARETGLPCWMPPKVDTDANDFHQEHGIRALANELNKLRRG